MTSIADRLYSVEEYYFSKKLREVHLLKAKGKPILNLAIGNPDLKPPKKVITALVNSLKEEKVHQYQSYQGIPELRMAISDFYRERYLVNLSPLTEVLPLMGSKSGILHISMAFLNKGDQVLIPNPGYPTYASVTKLLEAEPIYYDLNKSTNWLPDIKTLKNMNLDRVKLMWINYPHMPTGAKANKSLFYDLISFAKAHHIIIINDNPYSFILNNTPESLLSIKDSKEVCLELNSLSKTFNMAGWRMGMLLGSDENITQVLKIVSNIDSGMFYGLQQGAIQALKHSKSWHYKLNDIYKKRRLLVWKLADKLNCTYDKEATGLFVWAKLPVYIKAEQFVDQLLKDKNIFMTPGTIFGSNGEGYIRISLCNTPEILKEAINRI